MISGGLKRRRDEKMIAVLSWEIDRLSILSVNYTIMDGQLTAIDS